MTNNAQPSRNPANSSGDVSGGMRELFAKFLQSSIDDMLPAKIVAYDRDTNRATIKPMIAMVATNGDNISRNQLASIPVLNIGGGGSILSFNLSPGDLGWMKASDRDTADFLKRYSEAVPGTKRVHDFNNGLFIPDVMTGYTIDSEDAENAVLQTLDGTVRVSLFPDKLKLTAPTVEVDGQTEIKLLAPIVNMTGQTGTTITDLTILNGIAPSIIFTGATSIGLTAPTITLTGVIVLGGNVQLGGPGGQPIARQGDAVQVNPSTGTGTIIAGSGNHTAT